MRRPTARSVASLNGPVGQVAPGFMRPFAHAPGQPITVGDITGTVQAIEGATTVLNADDGRTVRVPNHLLLESVVTVHSE